MPDELEYEVIKSRRKTLGLEVNKEGRVIVRAPLRAGNREIRSFVEKNISWIKSHVAKAAARIERENSLPKLSETELNHLVKLAKKKIPERVAYYAPLVGVSYGRISIRKQRTRWGSCSKEGNLNFNALLLLAPPEVMDSVIVHELCHRLYMNHSKDFYNAVYRVFPAYPSCHKWLKINGDLLMSRIPEGK